MKTILTCIVILLVIIGCSVCAYAADSLRLVVDRRAFLKAIDQVESGGRDRALGRAGERSRYQLTEAAWYQHTRKDFSYAKNRMLAHGVAERHFDWIVSQLTLADWPADVESIATAWNIGLTATINNRVPSTTRDYAKRVENLYLEFLKGDES